MLSVACAVLGAVFLVHNLSARVPPEQDLERLSGTIDKVLLVDDLSGKPIALKSPVSSLQFTLEGVDGVFRYPNSWPGYSDAYQRLAFDVDVWVSRDAIGKPEPMVVYRLVQRTPKDWFAEPIALDYEAVVEARRRSTGSYLRLGEALLGATALFAAVALVLRKLNRGR